MIPATIQILHLPHTNCIFTATQVIFYFASNVNTAIIQVTGSALQPSVIIFHSQLKMPMLLQLKYHLI